MKLTKDVANNGPREVGILQVPDDLQRRAPDHDTRLLERSHLLGDARPPLGVYRHHPVNVRVRDAVEHAHVTFRVLRLIEKKWRIKS